MSENKLGKLLEAITKKHVYIQTHNYPDPDALATAKGLQVLLGHYGISSTICFYGHVQKQNTLNMIRLLDIDIHYVDTISFQENDEIILVDCQKGNANVQDFVGEEICCIDHHKMQATDFYRFFDIRSYVGACATIITDYFLENDIPIDGQLATSLLYGIKMDTSNLTRGVSNLDVDAFSYLYKIANHEILHHLDASALTLKDLRAYTDAIANIDVSHRIGFSDVGDGRSDEIISTIADFLLTLSEVDCMVTYSIREENIKFSIRSATEKHNCAQIIKEALKGFGDGGGHPHMAAGLIPMRDGMGREEAEREISGVKERITSILAST